MKRIVFTVTSDLSYDQRMQRICSSLAGNGYDVLLLGREKKDSIALQVQSFEQARIKCLFEKGKLFYLEFNIRILFNLLFTRADIICSIDLDTILPGFLISKIRNKPFVYDAHEYFTEVIEVVDRPLVKKIWLAIESFVVPKTKYAYTVSENLRKIFSDKYNVPFELIQNISLLENFEKPVAKERYIIYAGVVNEGRGLEELIELMPELPVKLMICGKGDIYESMVAKVQSLNLQDKVIFKGYVSPDKLKVLIREAYIGYLLLENRGLSYYYSLANKFFDYMHAGIPQVTINFPEYTFLNSIYKVAALVPMDKQAIKDAFLKLLSDETYYQELANNAIEARNILNWQKEEEKLVSFYDHIKQTEFMGK